MSKGKNKLTKNEIRSLSKASNFNGSVKDKLEKKKIDFEVRRHENSKRGSEEWKEKSKEFRESMNG